MSATVSLLIAADSLPGAFASMLLLTNVVVSPTARASLLKSPIPQR